MNSLGYARRSALAASAAGLARPCRAQPCQGRAFTRAREGLALTRRARRYAPAGCGVSGREPLGGGWAGGGANLQDLRRLRRTDPVTCGGSSAARTSAQRRRRGGGARHNGGCAALPRRATSGGERGSAVQQPVMLNCPLAGNSPRRDGQGLAGSMPAWPCSQDLAPRAAPGSCSGGTRTTAETARGLLRKPRDGTGITAPTFSGAAWTSPLQCRRPRPGLRRPAPSEAPLPRSTASLEGSARPRRFCALLLPS